MQVRPQLQDMVRKVHAVLPKGDTDDIVKRLLGQMADGECEGQGSSDGKKKPACLPVTAASNREACSQVRSWIDTNASRQVESHPAFARFKKKLKNELCCCSDARRKSEHCQLRGQNSEFFSLSIHDIMYYAASAVFEAVPPYVPTVAMGLSLIHESERALYESEVETAMSASYPSSCDFLMMKKDS